MAFFLLFFFFFNDTATTEIYTLSLHDALPISTSVEAAPRRLSTSTGAESSSTTTPTESHNWRRQSAERRSEEHTSELQSQSNIVCRLLLEKKKNVQLTATDAELRQPVRSLQT